jgi:hypothetical protein
MARLPLRVLTRFLYANLLPGELFRTDVDRQVVRNLFRTFVRGVEIENHSYCNRVCSFCPNAFLDRRSRVELMSDALFRKLIGDLASIDYRQALAWTRYHEPLAHDSIFERLAFARQALPHAFLRLTSNGDFLNREKLRRLEALGLNFMHISLYLPEGHPRDEQVVAAAIDKFLDRTGLTLGKPIDDHFWRLRSTSIQILLAVPDYVTSPQTSSRGGLLKNLANKPSPRTSVCFSPLHHLVIDYNGKAMLCCQVRSDAPEHQTSIIGDLAQEGYGLFDYYRDLAPARADLFVGGPKSGVCAQCNQNATGPWRVGRTPYVAAILNHAPGVPWALRQAQRASMRRRRNEQVD